MSLVSDKSRLNSVLGDQMTLSLKQDEKLWKHEERLDRLEAKVYEKIQPHTQTALTSVNSRIKNITTSLPFAPIMKLEDGSSWQLSHIFGLNVKVSGWAENHPIKVSKKPSVPAFGDYNHMMYDYDIQNLLRRNWVSGSLVRDTADGKYANMSKSFW